MSEIEVTKENCYLIQKAFTNLDIDSFKQTFKHPLANLNAIQERTIKLIGEIRSI